MSYVDTSVLVSYYCPEPRSAAAQAELGQLALPTISPLVEVELYSAVAQKVRRGDLDPADAHRILSLFQVHQAAGSYQFATVGPHEYELARDWLVTFTTPLRALDALHLAAASSHGLRILTADPDLARSAALLGVACRLIP